MKSKRTLHPNPCRQRLIVTTGSQKEVIALTMRRWKRSWNTVQLTLGGCGYLGDSLKSMQRIERKESGGQTLCLHSRLHDCCFLPVSAAHDHNLKRKAIPLRGNGNPGQPSGLCSLLLFSKLQIKLSIICLRSPVIACQEMNYSACHVCFPRLFTF